MDHSALIAKLQAWSMADGDFHRDRQLADECLIADGWQVEQNPAWEGGFRWWWGHVSCSEGNRPHVIVDLNTAVGVVPYGCDWGITVVNGKATAIVWKHGDTSTAVHGQSERPSVAILIAAFKVKQSLQASQPTS